MKRLAARQATWMLAASAVACAACADVWGFDDLRVGDASVAVDGGASDALGVQGSDAGSDSRGSSGSSSSSGGGSSSSGSSSSSSSSSSGGSSSSSSSSSGGGDDSGSSSSSSSSGGGSSSSSSGGTDATVESGSDDAGGFTCGPYVAPTCGAGDDGGLLYCDLRSNTCCVTLSLEGRCVANDGGAACAKSEVTTGCYNACDCPGGQVCCGVENGIAATTSCQTVAAGGSCQAPAGSGAAQFCTQDAECVNGAGCIAQTCTLGANLNICGLQSQAPFRCTLRDAGP